MGLFACANRLCGPALTPVISFGGICLLRQVAMAYQSCCQGGKEFLQARQQRRLRAVFVCCGAMHIVSVVNRWGIGIQADYELSARVVFLPDQRSGSFTRILCWRWRQQYSQEIIAHILHFVGG
eukprot:IDg9263t1